MIENLDVLTVDERTAAKLSGLSGLTLKRKAKEGHPVGRLKIGARVLYHRPTLERWLESLVKGPLAAGKK